MRRLIGYCMLLGLPLSAMGCAMCASPFDYCSPVFTGECGEGCHPYERAGSAFSGGYAPDGYYEGERVISDEVMNDSAQPQNQPEQPLPPGDPERAINYSYDPEY